MGAAIQGQASSTSRVTVNASRFAEVQNVYDHRSVIEYSWSQKTREIYAEKGLGLLPVLGLNVEFRASPLC